MDHIPFGLIFFTKRIIINLDGIAKEYMVCRNKKGRAKLEKKFFRASKRVNIMVRLFSPELSVPTSVKYYALMRHEDGWRTDI